MQEQGGEVESVGVPGESGQGIFDSAWDRGFDSFGEEWVVSDGVGLGRQAGFNLFCKRGKESKKGSRA